MEEIESAFDATICPYLKEIQLAEGFFLWLVFNQAASISRSVIECLVERIRSNDNIPKTVGSCGELDRLLERAGLVFVKSLNELGRTSEILSELKVLFGSVTAIPAKLIVTWSSFPMSDGLSSHFLEAVEEYLNSWQYMEEPYDHYACETAHGGGFGMKNELAVNDYLDVAEIYAIAFLGRTLKNFDLALSWVEKASLPEENRQDLLRQLYSMNSSEPVTEIDEHLTESSSIEDHKTSSSNNQEKNLKQALVELFKKRAPFCWFRSIRLKFGNPGFVISNGKFFLCCAALVIFHFIRKSNLKRLRRCVRSWKVSVKAYLQGN
ncbi:unnamed protein product [Cuscuta epithymum]|uniref:Uncharacterized protein n=2 Tax=Cuscuta epithymum TaxID=186058 RepID=A0AAV0FC72_9ASTE|nr:unnamed protein product [Cuscuta epithymum]CAH9133186.1 unnamed protein product [Cuscuta epithymum]